MTGLNEIGVTVVRPGEGEYVALPGFGAAFKLSSKDNGGEVSIVEHAPVRGWPAHGGAYAHP
jgi:hypothetical protein